MTVAGNQAGSLVVARMTPTSASGAAFTGRAGQTRPPIRSERELRAYGDDVDRLVGGEP
ncbi:hypothetical protein [Streptomyces sp. V1I6]|uniref:hypothetical protein n=1 Tax=Streptomyces sp. V1I6 TaxID=3042273 RepID=UPI00277D1FE3|nr:hypothetical protein [Streptomyces sp. V1I6]MDQ0840579.1 hypothetical protein [Streptomyces sp. V1I6]